MKSMINLEERVRKIKSLVLGTETERVKDKQAKEMIRSTVSDTTGLRKGTWTPEEDQILIDYLTRYGDSNWSLLPKLAGLERSGKSCRSRWMNYLRPGMKRVNNTQEEDETNMVICGESESESMISEKDRVIMEELVKGQEAATQLKVLLENPIGSEDSLSLSPEQLLENVLSSFSQTISIIKASSFHSPPPAPAPAPHVPGSTSYSMSGDCSVNWNRSQQGQRDDERLHEGSDHEMQNREYDSLHNQFRGKQKMDFERSWSLLTTSSDRNTDMSNSHDYSGPS